MCAQAAHGQHGKQRSCTTSDLQTTHELMRVAPTLSLWRTLAACRIDICVDVRPGGAWTAWKTAVLYYFRSADDARAHACSSNPEPVAHACSVPHRHLCRCAPRRRMDSMENSGPVLLPICRRRTSSCV